MNQNIGRNEATTDNYGERQNVSTRQLGFYTAVWVLSTALASFGPHFIWNYQHTFSSLAILLNLGLGIFMVIANIRHINGLDEMQRKIQLDAAGLALGVGIVGGLSYSLLDSSGMLGIHAEISHLIILMGLTYLITVNVGNRRYQ